jgi:cyclic di-GMP phosphodiesterase
VPDDRQLAGATLLIVDDSEDNVVLLESILQLSGAREVHSTTDPREALRLCAVTDPDVVLLDLRMPYVDGFGVLASLKDIVPADEHLPVLVLTADWRPELKDEVIAAGADDLVTKPFTFAEVIDRTARLVRRRVR